jgi:uncharacterized protein (DUF1330 family)
LSDHVELAAAPPGFLLVTLTGAAMQALDPLTRVVAAAGGRVLAAEPAAVTVWLEHGTTPKLFIIATWDSEAAVLTAWGDIAPEIAALGCGSALVAIAGACLAEGGLPDFPTRENAAPTQSAGPPAYMLIEGTVTAPEPMRRYRDIIFPMISARGGYYLVYAPRDALTILTGEWGEDALIVSRWPDSAAAVSFWNSDRYQTVAIPTRAGAGRFSVTLSPGPKAF